MGGQSTSWRTEQRDSHVGTAQWSIYFVVLDVRKQCWMLQKKGSSLPNHLIAQYYGSEGRSSLVQGLPPEPLLLQAVSQQLLLGQNV